MIVIKPEFSQAFYYIFTAKLLVWYNLLELKT